MIVCAVSHRLGLECLIIHICQLLGIIGSSLEPPFNLISKLISRAFAELPRSRAVPLLVVVSGSCVYLRGHVRLLYYVLVSPDPLCRWVPILQSLQSVLTYLFRGGY